MKKTYKKNKRCKKYKAKRANLTKKNKNKIIHRNKRRIFTGGKLIGQGNYGCVYRPDLTSTNKNSSSNEIVSKVVLKNNAFSEYRHEYKILKKMKEIDPKGLFHSLLIDAFELKNEQIPSDFSQCSLTKPRYTTDEFFVFNIAFCGVHNLSYYLKNAFGVHKDEKTIPEPSILFSLLTNVIVGIKKMIGSNIVHKTLNTDSIYLKEPISLDNPHCAKIIDYGDGESRKYKGYSDKNQDYITLFRSIISMLSKILKQSHNTSYSKIINDLISGFTELLNMVEKDNVSHDETIKNYILLLQNAFGQKYSEYASSKYK
uniref:Protein kinase domain-containing protein n=1 Tax=viral metagenome TaxID=1070528 RepID=A0A6C0F296_9ZZZZ